MPYLRKIVPQKNERPNRNDSPKNTLEKYNKENIFKTEMWHLPLVRAEAAEAFGARKQKKIKLWKKLF